VDEEVSIPTPVSASVVPSADVCEDVERSNISDDREVSVVSLDVIQWEVELEVTGDKLNHLAPK
jgi:hypothetical protein